MDPISNPGPDPDGLNTVVLLTSRLRLRPVHPSAAPDLYPLLIGAAGRKVTDNLVWDGPRSEGDMVAWGRDGQTRPFGEFGHHWSIHDLDGRLTGEVDRAFGAIGITPSSDLAQGDLGYWLGHPYWGHGLMSEAVEAVVTHAFTMMRFARIDAYVFTRNPASARLLRRAGFAWEGLERCTHLKRGRFIDQHRYALTADAWRRRLG